MNYNEKLTIEHLAPYLPYGLKYFGKERKPFHSPDQKLEMDIHSFDYFKVEFVMNQKDARICLRPLSDLTKEIEVNGEKFVPINKLLEIKTKDFLLGDFEYFTKRSKIISEITHFHCSALYDLAANHSFNLSLAFIDDNPHWVVKLLYKWHFDLEGLIEKELAIDINTLNK